MEKLNLNGFTGTETYTRGYLGVLLTDGIVYLAEKGECHWFISDACVIVKMNDRVKAEEFVSIKLKVDENDRAVVRYEDGNYKLLFEQKYNYTDFKKRTGLDNVNLYFVNNVLMLTSEY